MKQKKTFILALTGLAIMLIILPFVITFNELLTKIFESIALYRFIQEKIVPIQTVVVAVLLKPIGVEVVAYKDGILANGLPLRFSWNCLGWQSLLLYLITSVTALTGYKYTNLSKLKTFIYGLLGVFWINIFRIYIVVLLALYGKPIYRYIFHDYFAAISTIVFIFIFWWFSYSFILEEVGSSPEK